MKKNVSIKIKGVSKKYTLNHEKPTLVENISNRGRKEEFWALKNINLEIKKGERIGIIGPNGSGKTTLLEIIAGITTPTKGKIITGGSKIVSLIELEAGFHPELTGEENIFLNGMLIGMSKSEIDSKKGSIIKFSGVGKFIDSPLFSYSTGLVLRLGFSIAIHSDPDILILDENIHIGDKEFGIATYKKMRQLLSRRKTVIVASHDLNFIKNNCDRVIWLKNGVLITEGVPLKVINKYEESVN